MSHLSPSKFAELLPSLVGRLTSDLQREQEDCALPGLANDPFWATPEVDSKTVAKLSPAVKELTGKSLDPRWIQRGGYKTVEDAVAHIVSQIKEHLVAESVAPLAAAESEMAEAAN